jgi:hypothetical protein
MDQIVAYRMSPVHLAPLGRMGIMLEEGMIPSSEINQSVGIVHPALPGLEMIVKSFHRSFSSYLYMEIIA